MTANEKYKHGDKLILDVSGTKYDGHIEERMLNQWPDKRSYLFVIVDNTPVPHFPIQLKNFQENYGLISHLNTKQP